MHVASLYMMCDVLPTVSHLCCVLQSSYIDLSQFHSLVSYAIKALELLRVSTGPRVNTFDADLENSLAQFSVCPEGKQVSNKNACPFHQSNDFTHQRSITRYSNHAFSVLDPAKLSSSQEEIVSQKYGEAHVDTLEKHYGQGDSHC